MAQNIPPNDELLENRDLQHQTFERNKSYKRRTQDGKEPSSISDSEKILDHSVAFNSLLS